MHVFEKPRGCVHQITRRFALSVNQERNSRQEDIEIVGVVKDVRVQSREAVLCHLWTLQAFRVDDYGERFVVVEEAQPPEVYRQVRLYLHSLGTADTPTRLLR